MLKLIFLLFNVNLFLLILLTTDVNKNDGHMTESFCSELSVGQI